MRFVRLFFLVGLMALAAGACSNPTAPRYPQEKEEPGQEGPDSQGFDLSSLPATFLV